ncbi:NAD(P)-dependent oxidoreductase [Caldivirga sp. UBA161]|uniref:NAD(P)-dependent oxidoreductase n=1 Tax=Caldivirga sp. UBA161 TaxID=1915569 RepID=UPI0032E4909C
MRVGFIGLGTMGAPMAMNIHKAGFPLIVYNRTRSKAEPFTRLNIPVASSPREVAERSDVVICMLTDAPDLEQVLFGRNGVVEGRHEGLIVVDMSTNSPDYSVEFHRRLRELGIEFLDAPVTGGDKGAREGTLTIMVGGSRDTFERIKPIFEAMGKVIIYAGDVGSGQLLKLINQVVVGLNTLAMVEALTLAKRAGADISKVQQVLTSGMGNSEVIRQLMPRVLSNDFKPGFKASHLRKDLKYVIDLATRLNTPMPGVSILLQLYNALVALGLGDEGTQALIKLYDTLTQPKRNAN